MNYRAWLSSPGAKQWHHDGKWPLSGTQLWVLPLNHLSSSQLSVPDSTDPKGELPWEPKTLGNTNWKPLLWQVSTIWKTGKQRVREGKWLPHSHPMKQGGLGARAQTASFAIQCALPLHHFNLSNFAWIPWTSLQEIQHHIQGRCPISSSFSIQHRLELIRVLIRMLKSFLLPSFSNLVSGGY